MPTTNIMEKLQKRRQLRRWAILLGALAGLNGVQDLIGALSKQKQHTSILSGRSWVKELLHGNENRMKNNLGMRKHVFKKLVNMLGVKAGIGHTRYMGPEEQIAIFLYTAVINASNRKAAERFQHNGDTISK